MKDDYELPAYFNGRYMPLSQVKISPLDRGFLFGDSVYEVIPVYQGKTFGGTAHWQRLIASLNQIGMDCPYSIADFEAIAAPLLSQDHQAQYVYVQITRGVEPYRKHRFPIQAEPTLLLYSEPFTPPVQLDYAGCAAHFQQDLRWQKCQIKSTSLMGNVLAYQALYQAGYQDDEALLVRDEYVVEAPSSNLFIVKGDQVFTPPLDNILSGVTRNKVIALVQASDLTLIEKTPSMAQVLEADEVWVTNSIEELKPITQIEGKPVGHGKPGPIWQEVFLAYQKLKR